MIYMRVDMDSLAEIEHGLGMTKDKTKQVLKTAINNTAKKTITFLVNEAKTEHIIKKPNEVKKTLTVSQKARVGNLEAVVKSTGRINDLYSFSVRPNSYNPKNRPKAGHKGNVNRANSPGKLYYGTGGGKSKDLHKAFVVKFASGHISVAQRIPGSKRGMPNKYGKTAPPRPGRPNEEAIKTLYAPSIPTMLGYEQGVFGVVNPMIHETLNNEIMAQMKRYLG